MSLQLGASGPVPEETARVARAAFPKGNVVMQMRDVLGVIYADADFAALFPARGRPAEAPWRLALVTVMQFREGLSDRQAAEAVRGRIDWKYALGLELTDPGFDFTVLCEFRARLVAGSQEHLLLDKLLDACRARGLLAARGRQRTDATHVLGAVRVLSRLELVAETLRAALEAIAATAPGWAQTHLPAAWTERYARRIEEYRLPRGKADRATFAVTVGGDGQALLARLAESDAPPRLRDLAAIQVLQQVWEQQFTGAGEALRLREVKELPTATAQIASPYETEARFGVKREQGWTGYKTHLTETADDERPHLLTQVTTTLATATDFAQVAPIQADLARRGLLPGQHLVDGGYLSGRNLVASQTTHGIELVGPMVADHQWQAKADTGFARADFQIDWDAQVARCPGGQTSVRWAETTTRRGPRIHVAFAAAACAACPTRTACTRATTGPRQLNLLPRAETEAIQAARQRQETREFRATYARRAGIEGTLSLGGRAFGLRRARYRGLAKTHLQQVATATAINLDRIDAWLHQRPRATPRRSHLARLAPAA